MSPEEIKKVRKMEDDLAELETLFLAIYDYCYIIKRRTLPENNIRSG